MASTPDDCSKAARIGRAADRCEVHHEHQHDHDHPDHAGHSHGGLQDHTRGRESDRRRLLIALGISGAILVAEVIGGLIAHSLALLSDAEHVLADMSAQILTLIALLLSSRPADARRTFGYYRLEILAALANGVVLVGLAVVIFISAARRIGSPVHVEADIMVPIAACGLVANLAGAWLLRGAQTLNVRGAYLHVLSDALALVAVIFGGLLMMWRPELSIVDPLLGIGIAIIVVVGAFRLLREATDVLLEAVPHGIDVEKVRDDVLALADVEDVHDLHIWTITSGLHALSAHIIVKTHTTACHDDVLTCVKELLLRRHRIAHSTLQIESPDYEHVEHVAHTH